MNFFCTFYFYFSISWISSVLDTLACVCFSPEIHLNTWESEGQRNGHTTEKVKSPSSFFSYLQLKTQENEAERLSTFGFARFYRSHYFTSEVLLGFIYFSFLDKRFWILDFALHVLLEDLYLHFGCVFKCFYEIWMNFYTTKVFDEMPP